MVAWFKEIGENRASARVHTHTHTQQRKTLDIITNG